MDSALRAGIRGLVKARGKSRSRKSQALAGQPFDAELLEASPLYRASRRAYLKLGGVFEARLVSAGRTLSSAILLEPRIEYSPVEDELLWRALDPIEAKRPGALTELRRFTGSVFHEQNHRILWSVLPPVSRKGEAARRYLNFAEAVVIATDMALADGLEPRLARVFHATGVIYDPGTDVRKGLSRRQYRNYLHACLHATYLLLEGYRPADVAQLVRVFHAQAAGSAPLERALARAGNLNAKFLSQTNLVWQRRHLKKALEKLSKGSGEPLVLSADPGDYFRPYILAEQWFERMGL